MYFLGPVPDNAFVLGPVDGLLRVVTQLDREKTSMYNLTVRAHDRGFPPQSSVQYIVVHILDENDNPPVMNPAHYSAIIPENASIGLSVVTVTATDADDGLNGRIRYQITAGDENHDFTIADDYGIIRVAKNLNYESKNKYVLTVTAEDSGTEVRYSTATVNIDITDINDNAPVFQHSPYLVWVMEGTVSQLPQVITRVTAYDADTKENNQVSYLIKDGGAGFFKMDAMTGDVELIRELDREKQEEYTLTVVAMDTGKALIIIVLFMILCSNKLPMCKYFDDGYHISGFFSVRISVS